jgi:hypothetical protein
MDAVRSENANGKEEELLRLVASLIVEIILKEDENECDRIHPDKREGSVKLLTSLPGKSD